MNIDFKKLLPHLLVVLAFIAISLAYFFPVLEGKVIEQHDIAQWEGMSKEIVDFREKYKEEPLWTRSMFEECLHIRFQFFILRTLSNM
ncbi:MAG: hypothetical protein IPN13_24790 [Bacteroidetes bacterium]|nr:hypothetical protein [Bacteroidota bacterium]